MGYDQPRSLGDFGASGALYGTDLRDFMKMALAGKPIFHSGHRLALS